MLVYINYNTANTNSSNYYIIIYVLYWLTVLFFLCVCHIWVLVVVGGGGNVSIYLHLHPFSGHTCWLHYYYFHLCRYLLVFSVGVISWEYLCSLTLYERSFWKLVQNILILLQENQDQCWHHSSHEVQGWVLKYDHVNNDYICILYRDIHVCCICRTYLQI